MLLVVADEMRYMIKQMQMVAKLATGVKYIINNNINKWDHFVRSRQDALCMSSATILS